MGNETVKPTFLVTIQFQQNATWQGTITWTEKNLTQRFRSTLEMIKLMDDAARRCLPNDGPTWDDAEEATE